jgi:hypothetical protein
MAKIINSPAAPASWLFVEDAAAGTITGPDDQHLKLKLKRMRRNITAITAGNDDAVIDALLSNEEFFTAWPKTFADEPPTAVLSYDLPGKSQPTNIILTLTNPQYDAVKRTVVFDAVRVMHETTYQNPKANLYPTAFIHPKVTIFTDATMTIIPFRAQA